MTDGIAQHVSSRISRQRRIAVQHEHKQVQARKDYVRSDQSMRITFDVPVDERNVVGGGREPAWAAVKSTMMFWSVSEGLGKTREASQNSVNRKEER